MTNDDLNGFDDNALREIAKANGVTIDRPITRAKLVDALSDAELVGADGG